MTHLFHPVCWLRAQHQPTCYMLWPELKPKPNVYRRFSFFLPPHSPTLSPQGVEGRKHVVRLRRRLIEPTCGLPLRLFAPSRQGPLDCPLPAKGEVGRGSGPSVSRRGNRPSPCQGRGKAEGSTGCMAEWHHSNRPPAFRGAEPPKKRGPRCPRAPQADGVLRCWI